ncbi:endoplasmic reticulum vesicle transporter-domain-containing protein [Kockovaella imperatae]|uniref:Endoplasmic reticulum vesicle transporter-domain-containing protein n=1 Tax=Kockovaella imperatae TaxID=4999 RepID=A0A1Y1UCJ5_9TREE|nr:endoplasmic reticulum vesicle transporter-domain-containing protein [Kockovaella imperatae]ORX35771.1 endoplasmic reticulum vesicle transporter-domain-containing protein [Kockovaella imperatae]
MDMMYDPHLGSSGHNSRHDQEGSLLQELDKIAPIKSFDAFPKVQSTYVSQSRQGGVLTAIVSLLCIVLVLNDLGDYLYGPPDYAFQVDHGAETELQLNVDLTVAMPCHYLSIDLRDAVGDRVHLSNDFVKDGTSFNVGKASSLKLAAPTNPSASEVISSARRRTPNQRGSFAGLRRLFAAPGRAHHTGYRPTELVKNGPACRIYGSVNVKKVTANLHITTLGHGYMSMEHTDHSLMNLSHIVHEFSFGPFFPAISQPLDLSMEITDKPFTIFQYFLRVVPTTYIDSSRRKLVTSQQYAVTDYSRSFEHGGGIPGVFFRYDLDPMSLTIKERSTSFYQFFLRLTGAIVLCAGGVWTVAAFGMRIVNRAQRQVKRMGQKDSFESSSYSSGTSLSQRRVSRGNGVLG